MTEWLPNYTFILFWQDLLAGFTVALTEIPQAIAYAYVAGKITAYIILVVKKKLIRTLHEKYLILK